MADLRGTQQAFRRYLMLDDEDVKTLVADSDGAITQHRLATYYNAYRNRLIDALAANYPAVQQYLGEQAFEQLALAYLDSFPSMKRSVRWFGDQLAAFLSTRDDLQERELLSEIARFEWARVSVFDARDSDCLVSLQEMAELPVNQWPQTGFEFISAMRILDLSTNAPQLANAIEANQPRPAVEYQSLPVRWLIWRQGHNIVWRSLAVHEAWAIEAAINGDSFSLICEGLQEWLIPEQVAMAAAGIVKQWITDQLITKLQ